MCMRQGYPPVFLRPDNWQSPFLDDLIGKSFADDLRTLFGFPVVTRSPFGIMCGGDDSYLTSAFSSSWALLVFLIAFGAGLLFRTKRRLASWLLVICAIVPILDTGVRVYLVLEREAGHTAAAEFRTTVLHNLPAQMMTNALFQLVLPFVVGLTLALLVSAAKWIVAIAWSQMIRGRR